MPAKREKTDKTAEYFGLPKNLLRDGALNGLLKGCFFEIGRRGDRVWDWDLLELRLKELCQETNRQPECKQAIFGKLRRIN